MINLLDYIDPPQHALIFSGQGIYADAALASAIAFGVSLGTLPAIQLPAGTLKFASTIHLKNRVNLIGQGSGVAGSVGPLAGTTLQFDSGLHGIVVHRYDTCAAGMEVPPTTAADGSTISGVVIKGQGGAGHGVWMRARAVVRDCAIHGFGQNGINIVAGTDSQDATLRGNANGWQLDTLVIANCGGHGVFVDGADASAGFGRAIDVSQCGGWGVYDSSFLGNTWQACQAADNVLGPYKSDDPNAWSVFEGCYSEGGQPPSSFVRPTLVLNGLHGAGVTGSGLFIGAGGISAFSVPNPTGDNVGLMVGLIPNAYLNFTVPGDHDQGWAWMYDGYWKSVVMKHGGLDSRTPFLLTTDLTPLHNEVGQPLGPGKMILNGAWVSLLGGGRYKWVDFKSLDDRIAALEAAQIP